MEVSFSREVEMLRHGRGEVFHGEGILAITKALRQSGVAPGARVVTALRSGELGASTPK